MGGVVTYLRSHALDFALLWVLTASASGLVVSGYNSGDAFLAAVAPVVVVPFVVLLVLYTCSFSRRAVVVGVVVVPVLTVVAMVVASGFWDGGSTFEDAAGNPCPPLLASIVTTVVVYLLTRRRPGIVVLVAAGILTVGYLQFIYKENHVLLALVFFAGCFAVLAWRGFELSRRASAQRQEGAALGFGLCCACALAVVAICAGVHAAIIAPLNPPTMEVKLIKEYLALPQLDLRGVANQTELENQQRQSERTNDVERQSSLKGGEQNQGDQGSGVRNAPLDGASQDAYSPDAADPGYSPSWQELLARALIWPLLLIVLVVAAVLVKLWLRRRWLAKLHERGRPEQVDELYRFWLKRFARMRVTRHEFHTPSEFAAASAVELEAFCADDGTDFACVTGVFERTAYGRLPVSDDDLARVWAFQDAFCRNAREHLGRIKYALLFFVL